MLPATDTSYHTTKPQSNHYDFEAFSLPLSDGNASGLFYIEQLAAQPGCSTPNRPWMVAQNANTKMAIFFQPTCKLWSCPFCAEINAKRWVLRGFNGVQTLQEKGITVDFVTITSHEKLSAEQTFRVFPLAWPKLYRRYKRAVEKSDPKAFIAVPERHKDGRLHSHLLISGHLGTRWWKDNARECGLGYKASEDEIKTLGIAAYISKYISKTLDEKWPKGKRRVNTSRTWPALPEMPLKLGWSFRTMATDEKLKPILGDLTGSGYTVFGVPTAKAWTLLDDLSVDGSEQ
jgi:hypothetical protein